jgi:outer membrane murein-binding lipoprotein Lpp
MAKVSRMTSIVFAADISQIISAAITGGLAFAGVIWQARKTRRINTQEHGMNTVKLESIENKIDHANYQIDRVKDNMDDVNSRLDNHFEWHNRRGIWKRKTP